MSGITKALFLVFAFACLLVSVRSQDTGSCPDNSICVPGFDLEQFLGVWYEVATSPTSRLTFERNCTCTFATYSLNDDGSILVENRCNMGSAMGNEVYINGTAMSNPDLPSEIEVSFGGPYGPYWVVENDNYDVIVVWSCTQLGSLEFSYMWVLARTPTIDQNVYDSITAKAADVTGYDTSRLIMTDQNGCTYETDDDNDFTF